MGACVTHKHARTQHTHREAGSQPCLEAVDRNIFLLSWWLWHLPSIRIIINYSRPQQRVSVSVCVCVCVWTSVCMTVCVITICSHRIFGEPRSTVALWESDSRLCFLEHGLVSVDIRRAGTWCFNFGLASADSHRASSVWGLFTVESCWLFLFLWHLVLFTVWIVDLNFGCKPVSSCFWIYFVDLSKCLKQIICSLCPGDI